MNVSQPLWVALSYLRHHKLVLFQAIFWRGVFILVPMQVPILTGIAVDGLTGNPISLFGVSWEGALPLDVLQIAVGGLFLVALFYGLSAYAQRVATAKLSRNFVFDLRRRLIAKITSLSLDQHHRYGSGEFLDRVLGDTGIVRRFVDRVFVQAMANFLRIGYPVAMLIIIDVWLAAVALSVLPVQWLLCRVLQRQMHSATHRSRANHSELTSVVKESLDGVETLKVLHAELNSVAKAQVSAKKVEQSELVTNRLSALISGNIWLLTSIGVALTWWQGGMLVLSEQMTIGKLIEFSGFVVFAYRPFRQFTTIATTYREGLVSLERIQEMLGMPSRIQVSPDAQPIEVSDGHIAFENVSFSYGKRRILRNVDLSLSPRTVTAIVGRSGSGKSSILRLIARLYDPQRGRILIDGQPIGGGTLESLRSHVAAVPQHPVLFTGSVLDNVRLGQPEATIDDVRAACEASFAIGFIDRLDEGLYTRVGRGGSRLSGGELRRLAVARALVCQPKILLMDEPTSGLDAESEAAIVETLHRLRGDMTIIVVGHRHQIVLGADHIIVLDAGRVVANGTHDQLLDSCGVYCELFEWKQFSAA